MNKATQILNMLSEDTKIKLSKEIIDYISDKFKAAAREVKTHEEGVLLNKLLNNILQDK